MIYLGLNDLEVVPMSMAIEHSLDEVLISFAENCKPLSPLAMSKFVSRSDVSNDVYKLMIF
jgi:hypothetical protein